jgi:hypothetical protein
MGVELFAKTLGLIGCGNIGGIVADRANGLKMKVIAFDPFLSEKRAVEIGVEKVELPELLARALAMEANAELTSVKGLGRSFAWGDLVRYSEAQLDMFQSSPEIPCGCYDGNPGYRPNMRHLEVLWNRATEETRWTPA